MRKLMWIVWPSFLAAGILSGVVFGFVDPNSIYFLGTHQLDENLVYALGFFAFWIATALASTLTLALSNSSETHIFGDGDDEF